MWSTKRPLPLAMNFPPDLKARWSEYVGSLNAPSSNSLRKTLMEYFNTNEPAQKRRALEKLGRQLNRRKIKQWKV